MKQKVNQHSANLLCKRDGFQFPVRFQVPLHEQVAGDTWPETQFCSVAAFDAAIALEMSGAFVAVEP